MTHKHEIDKIKKMDLYRRLRVQKERAPARAVIDGHEAVLFSGNDYLGLSRHPEVVVTASDALRRYGTSASASRLVSGNHELYETLESTIAAFKAKDQALVFSSGYLANIGLMTSLAGKTDTIYLDKLSHASLYDGCRLSEAALRRYHHNDLDHLESLLTQDTTAKNRFIVTDGLFSMDGDLAPLDGLRRLSDRYGCWLVVDDAHGAGVLGAGGRGTSSHFDVEPDVEIGTLSKSFGSLGGYVAGSTDLIRLLVNKARSFIFTTGLPPASLAAATVALRVAEDEPWRRERVLDLARHLRLQLTRAGYEVPAGFSPIVPIIVGAEQNAVNFARTCLERGIFVPAVRAPAVARGRARLRVTVSALHSDTDIETAIDVLTNTGRNLGLL